MRPHFSHPRRAAKAGQLSTALVRVSSAQIEAAADDVVTPHLPRVDSRPERNLESTRNKVHFSYEAFTESPVVSTLRRAQTPCIAINLSHQSLVEKLSVYYQTLFNVARNSGINHSLSAIANQ